MWNTLVAIRDTLGQLPDVKTCRIGIESGLSPDDYPIIRLVPSSLDPASPWRSMNVLVYYGAPLAEADQGLEALYEALFGWEERIREALRVGKGYRCKWLETVTDEDRLEHYKLFASRFEVTSCG